jgi:uncharacterized protein
VIYSQPILITKFAVDPDESEIGVFQAVASTAVRDRQQDIVQRNAFSESIQGLMSGQHLIPFLLNHNPHEQLGGIKQAAERDDGLFVTGQIVRGTPAANRVYALAKAGDVSVSIGFNPVEHEPLPGGGRLYKRVDLVEISATSTPANRGARILSIKEMSHASPDEFERLFRDRELPLQSRRLEAKMARACFDILNDIDPDEPDTAAEAALRAALAGTTQVLKRGK